MQTPNFEIPTEMRDFAEKSVDQARKAFDGFIGAAHKAMETLEGSTSSMQANATETTRKSLSYAEQNSLKMAQIDSGSGPAEHWPPLPYQNCVMITPE